MPIFGWDASHYDKGRGPNTAAYAVAQGMRFVTHKATEGTTYIDPTYGDFMAPASRLRDAAVMGAYHVLHTANPQAQVNHFLATLNKLSPWWKDGPFLIQLDCERWPTDFPSKAAVDAWLSAWRAVAPRYQPVVYASKGQYGDTLKGIKAPLWNASYPTGAAGSASKLYPGDSNSRWGAYSGQTPAILQFTSNGTIGSQNTCDLNAYKGSLAQLRALVTPTQEDDMDAAQAAMLADIHYATTHIVNAHGVAEPLQVALHRIQTEGVPVTAQVSVDVDTLATALAAKLNLSADTVKAAVRTVLKEGTDAS